MNKQLIIKRSFAAALFAASMTAETTTPFIGAGAGQIVRLKVAGADGLGERCAGQIGFRDQHGKQVGPATRVDLAPGEAASIDLPTKAGEHANVRAMLPTEGGKCGAAIEVLDGATGRTVARTTPTSRFSINFTRTPLGLASGQTMRVAIGSVDNPDLRCLADVSLSTPDGRVLAQAQKVYPLPGHAFFLDLNSSQLQGAKRGELVPAVKPMAPGSAEGCVVSVEVFDTLTGWSSLLVDNPDI